MKYELKPVAFKINLKSPSTRRGEKDENALSWVDGYAVHVPNFPVRFAVSEELRGWRATDWETGFAFFPYHPTIKACIKEVLKNLPGKVASGEYARARERLLNEQTINILVSVGTP